jgi:hypothetical protein
VGNEAVDACARMPREEAHPPSPRGSSSSSPHFRLAGRRPSHPAPKRSRRAGKTNGSLPEVPPHCSIRLLALVHNDLEAVQRAEPTAVQHAHPAARRPHRVERFPPPIQTRAIPPVPPLRRPRVPYPISSSLAPDTAPNASPSSCASAPPASPSTASSPPSTTPPRPRLCTQHRSIPPLRPLDPLSPTLLTFSPH